jgi:hypothetical protein
LDLKQIVYEDVARIHVAQDRRALVNSETNLHILDKRGISEQLRIYGGVSVNRSQIEVKQV